jgi:hypothetical protein
VTAPASPPATRAKFIDLPIRSSLGHHAGSSLLLRAVGKPHGIWLEVQCLSYKDHISRYRRTCFSQITFRKRGCVRRILRSHLDCPRTTIADGCGTSPKFQSRLIRGNYVQYYSSSQRRVAMQRRSRETSPVARILHWGRFRSSTATRTPPSRNHSIPLESSVTHSTWNRSSVAKPTLKLLPPRLRLCGSSQRAGRARVRFSYSLLR